MRSNCYNIILTNKLLYWPINLLFIERLYYVYLFESAMKNILDFCSNSTKAMNAPD